MRSANLVQLDVKPSNVLGQPVTDSSTTGLGSRLLGFRVSGLGFGVC